MRADPWPFITSTDYISDHSPAMNDIRTHHASPSTLATIRQQATDCVQHPDHLSLSTFLKRLVNLWAAFISPSQVTFFQEAGSKACGSYSAVYAEQKPPHMCAIITYRTGGMVLDLPHAF